MDHELEMRQVIDLMVKDPKVRKAVATKSHRLFFGTYFGHYIEHPFGDFHRELFQLTEDESVSTLVVTAARGTGKSTILNMSLAIWSVLGAPQKKYVVILGQTQAKAKQHFTNLRKELESNALLRSDLGPFKAEESEWSNSLVIPMYDARITFASTEQSLRGMRHKQHRPDLFIADDLEDNESVKTLEGRNKVYDWLVKDIIPAGSQRTRLVVIGTLLHEDSIMMRLKKELAESDRDGVYREYPLLNESSEILWLGKYPDHESIEAERRRVGDEKAWHQEYLLHIVSDADRVIHPEWIKRYESLPARTRANEYRGTYIGVDLAISEKERADYTAMVAVAVYGWGKDMCAYILPQLVHERLDFPSALEKAKALSSSLGDGGRKAQLYIENNHYQESFVQMMKKDGYPAEGIRSQGDKRTRLTLVNPAVKNGVVLFPAQGVETLIAELVGFGVERHDDLADAFAIVVGENVKSNKSRSALPVPTRPGGGITDELLDMTF